MARTKPLSPNPTLAELKRKLTAKQLKSAELLAREGISKVAAYRKVYDTSGYSSASAVRVDACRTLNKPNVVLATELIRKAYETPALQSAAATRAFVLDTLHELASSANQESVRLQAAAALGKVSTVGLFVDRKEIVHRQAGSDTAVDLVERLKAVAAQIAPAPAPAIETTAVLELEPPADLATDEAPIDLSTIGNSK